MSKVDQIKQHLAALYGQPAAQAAWIKLAACLDQYRAANPPQPPIEWSEKDALLITYGDTFTAPGRPGLHTLAEFMDTWLDGAINGVHILPFYPYTSDDGFSVSDYRCVDPRLGGWDDVARLRGPAGARRLMFDGVINHVSQASDWFQAYLRGQPPYDGYFIEARPDWDLSQVARPRTLPLLTGFSTANGPRQVWTTFSADQIDLNYANPAVLLEIVDLLLFYAARGAALIRLDAIAYLWKQPGTACIHLEQTHRVVKILRLALDLAAPHVALITETNVPHAENISYFGRLDPLTGRSDEAQLVYQFPLAPLILHSFRSGDATALSRWAADLEAPGLFFNFTASHDGIGLLPARSLLPDAGIHALADAALAHGGQVSYKANPDGSASPYELNITFYDALNDPNRPDPETDRTRFLASQAIMLSLAGVPGVYAHSLFGSRNCLECVAETGRARSINRARFDYPALAAELANGQSERARIFAAYRRMLIARASLPAFHPHGRQTVLSLGPAVFAVLRRSIDETQAVLCLVNVSPQPQAVRFDPGAHSLRSGGPWRDVLSGQGVNLSGGVVEIVIQPYQALWLALT